MFVYILRVDRSNKISLKIGYVIVYFNPNTNITLLNVNWMQKNFKVIGYRKILKKKKKKKWEDLTSLDLLFSTQNLKESPDTRS